jgi:hypothetical protein
MKPKTLGLIHTSHTLIPVFQQLCQEYLPGVKTFNIVDDSLVKNIIARNNEVTPSIYKRVADYVDHQPRIRVRILSWLPAHPLARRLRPLPRISPMCLY